MSVIALVVILIFLAVIWYFVNVKYGASMNPTIKLLINIVVIATAIILVLSAFGIWQQLKSVRVPQI